jgi:hypothetical protein
MGSLLRALGRDDDALEHLREALRLNPDHPQAPEVRTWLAARG